nr:hypothetical protein BaRGS_017274 [Batillaria attramentaria]
MLINALNGFEFVFAPPIGVLAPPIGIPISALIPGSPLMPPIPGSPLMPPIDPGSPPIAPPILIPPSPVIPMFLSGGPSWRRPSGPKTVAIWNMFCMVAPGF